MSKLQDKIQVRVDSDTKKEARKTLERMGLTMSGAVKLFLRQVITTDSIPFEVRTENGFTPEQEQRMIRETEEAIKNGKRYENYDEMVADLENDDE